MPSLLSLYRNSMLSSPSLVRRPEWCGCPTRPPVRTCAQQLCQLHTLSMGRLTRATPITLSQSRPIGRRTTVEYCGAHQALLPDINTLRAGTVMGLSNGFGAIAGIIVPLGKPSIVKSGCQLQLDEIDNSNLYRQTQYSQFCFQNLKSLLISRK